MNESHIHVEDGVATTFVGHDATNLFRAITLKNAISLYQKSGLIPTRGVTITKMLVMATGYTQKPYRGKTKCEDAIKDLTVWIETMKSAIPVTKS